jgi:enoyl-CoA hydratase/carnithine racemase
MNSIAQIREETQPLDSGGAIRWLIGDNPGRLNAWTEAMWTAMPALVRAADADPEIRVIVLTGAGDKAFSAGADISEFDGQAPEQQAERHNDFDNSAFGALIGCGKPVIAMIHGICFGGGCELALCCDFRLAADTARFSIPPARLGIGYNARWIRPLINVVGPTKAKEILMTGRRYDARQALAMGLVGEVVAPGDLRAATEALARELATNAPLSVRAAKLCVDALAHPDGVVDMDRLDAAVMACFKSTDFAEGKRAFAEKRAPKFKGK